MTQILHKRSAEPLKVPLITDLASGEIAINTTDGRLFIKKTVVDLVDPAIIVDTIVPISNDYNDLVNVPSINIENNGTIRFPTSLEFPEDLGSSGLVLTTNGAGQLSWAAFGASGGVSTTVRYDINYQNLTSTQKQNARTNIGLSPVASSGNYNDLHGAPTVTIKTFNILGSFSAPLLGTAIFVPISTSIITSVQLVIGRKSEVPVMVGLYKSGELIRFFSIESSQISALYTGLSIGINTNDRLTVSVVAGASINLSMSLLYNPPI